jgi:hypothetical protein
VVRALGLIAMLAAFAGTVSAKDFLDILARDQCDPATFNAGRTTPLCSGSNTGSVTLAQFQAALPNGGHHAWKFNPGPSGGHVDFAGLVRLTSDAGETHTFTQVAAFGGGFVTPLNVAVGNAPTAPECAAMVAGGPLHATAKGVIVPADSAQFFQAGGALLPSGIHLYQCCIHPWMRTIITVR